MSSPPRKRVRSSFEDPPGSGSMIQEDGSGTRSPSGERRSKKAMKIQGGRNSAGSSSSPPAPTGGRLLSEDDSEQETGEFSPANSGVDPNFLRQIKKSGDLTKLDQEIVRLIGQHLCDVGLRTSADVLMKEAGCRLDQPTAATFRHCVMKGDWTGAVNVLEDLSMHLEDKTSHLKMKYILLEQKYMEHLSNGNTLEALKVLQLELTPLNHNRSRTHELTSYLMLGQAPPHSSSSDSSRAEVMEKLQEYLPPSVMLPPRRLTTLLDQAAQHQRNTCIYHNKGENRCGETFATDNTCTKEMFPCETIQVLMDHGDEVWYCKWSPNGRYLATGSKDATVIIWELDPELLQLKQNKVLEEHSYGVVYLSWSPDSSRLAVCGPDDGFEVWIWDVNTGRLETKVSHSNEDSLTCVAWSPDGSRLACGGNKGQFYQCDSHGTVLDSWEGVRVHGLAYRQDGKQILASDTHHRIRSYNFEELSDTPVLQEEHAIMSFTVDQTDRYALLNIATQGLRMWDIQNRSLVRKFNGITQGFYIIHSCFGGINQSFVASGSEDNKVYIFNVKKDDPIAVLGGHTRTVNCVAWNPVYPQILASVSDDSSIRLWGPASQYRQGPILPPPGNPPRQQSLNNGAV